MASSAAFIAAASMNFTTNSMPMLFLSLCSCASLLLVAVVIVQVRHSIAPDLADVAHVTSEDEVDERDQLVFSLDLHEKGDDVSQLRCRLLHAAISSSRSAQGSTRPADAGWAHHLLEYWAGACELPKLVGLPR